MSGEDLPFLGVRKSARSLVWKERLKKDHHNLALTICQQHGVPDLLGRVLAARGVKLDDVPLFLDPSLKGLMPDPSTLKDMEKAAERIGLAILNKENVAIFGDYDVDGACSAALLERFLQSHHTKSRIYIPDRIFEGYGPNITALEMLVGEGAQLLITVDCGSTSIETMQAAKALKRDILVIDHHQTDASLPDVYGVVNPNRQDDLSGQGHLCAAGVVFLLLVAVVRQLRKKGYYNDEIEEPSLMQELDIVALATVADVVPLMGLNRAYVRKGLAVMRSRENVGLRALSDASGLHQAPTTFHLGYILGPRINAGGRIGDASLGARLLTARDDLEAQRIAILLDKLNKERKEIETQMLEEAFAQADRKITEEPDSPILFVGSETWHKGVVGLVASRIVERFHRPCCALSWERTSSAELVGTGSLRSVVGIDIGTIVRAAFTEGILVKGGGHAMAAGLTVRESSFLKAQTFFFEKLSSYGDLTRSAPKIEIDGALIPSSLNSDLIDLLEKAGPYGQSNPQPRFAFPSVRIKYAKQVGDVHIRCVLEASDGSKVDGIAFRAVGQPLGHVLQNTGGMPMHVAGTIKKDSWGGREKIDLTIEDAADPRKQD
ncbi:MAG: single-stranded-DNA-specific exonuclease RecJ [Hyphomicrobium sp.]